MLVGDLGEVAALAATNALGAATLTALSPHQMHARQS